MTTKSLSTLVLAISLLIVAGVFAFQYGVGLVPCELCLKERLPWYSAIVLALLFIFKPSLLPPRSIAIIFGLLFATSAALGFYHVGVEQGFLPGPDSCTAPPVKATSIEELTRQLMATPPVRCDQIQWSLMGVSLAGWNLLASLAMAGLAIRSALRRQP